MAKKGASSRAWAVKLSRRSGLPLYLQICESIRRAMEAGQVRKGANLPSTRMLAKELGVSRNTVMQAYEELSSQGLIRAKQGTRAVIAGGRNGGARAVHWKVLLERSGYPAKSVTYSDPDGTPLYAFSPIVARQARKQRKS